MSDEIFAEVIELVYGPGSELISKMEPTQSDLSTSSKPRKMTDRQKRAATAGLSAVGATAGAAGLALGTHNIGRAYKVARFGAKGGRAARAAKHAASSTKPLMGRRAAFKTAVGKEKLASALLPLEVAGLGGELMATKILHNDVKKKGSLQPVQKNVHETVKHGSDTFKSGSKVVVRNAKEIHEESKAIPLSTPALARKVITDPRVQAKGREYSAKGKGTLKALPGKVKAKSVYKKGADPELDELLQQERDEVASGGHLGRQVKSWQKKNPGKDWQTLQPLKKNDDEIDVVWDAEISKADADKQQVFGWASVVEVNGEPIVDLQGDQISVDEMERAGYEYVMKSRKGGDMHLRNNWEPIQKSEMIESFIVTPEKREAMGLPDSVPSGWWVGFKVQDPSVWDMVKRGERTGFSIHGHGRRT